MSLRSASLECWRKVKSLQVSFLTTQSCTLSYHLVRHPLLPPSQAPSLTTQSGTLSHYLSGTLSHHLVRHSLLPPSQALFLSLTTQSGTLSYHLVRYSLLPLSQVPFLTTQLGTRSHHLVRYPLNQIGRAQMISFCPSIIPNVIEYVKSSFSHAPFSIAPKLSPSLW